MENVENGASVARRNGFSTMRSYSSVFMGPRKRQSSADSDSTCARPYAIFESAAV